MIKRFSLGVIKEGKGVRFSVFSEHAQKIELCLFSEDEKTEKRIALSKDENNVWSAVISHIKPGQKYGYRAYGEFNPQKGLFFNPNKLLIDPFAKELSSSVSDWEDPALSLTNNLDSAHAVPKAVVVFEDKGKDELKYPYLHQKPNIDWKDTIIYEANVSLSRNRSQVKERPRS